MNDASSQIAAQVAADVSAEIIKTSINTVFHQVSSFVTVKRTQFFERFEKYSEYMFRKSSLVRTLYSKSKPVLLDEMYVVTKFSHDKSTCKDAELIERFGHGRRIIVKGNGGSGKTIFLKHLWLSRFRNPQGRIPIFIELRRMNDLQSVDIGTFCRSELQADSTFGNGVFEKLCESGKFEFIFDGFDEVMREKRKKVERQILDLSERYDKCCFLVSGREDDRFSSWGSFEIYTVEPLDLVDLKKLINKVSFDTKVKKKFLETLTEDFYREHQSFLSSPLLAVMMLMTFNENAIIPSKLTTFYNSAFQTLLTWHDATKDSFERDRKLSVDEFRKVFSTFCLISYYEQSYDFDETQLRKYVSKALSYHKVDVDVDEAINDICESVNLLQKDGLKYVFVHRSFQEYFAAECTMQVVSGKAGEFLESFSRRLRDSVFFMCYEIHPELVYDQFLKGNIERVESSKVMTVLGKKKQDLLSLVFKSITIDMVPGGLRFRLDADRRETDELRILHICRRISGVDYDAGPDDIIINYVLDRVYHVLTEKVARLDVNQALKVKVEFLDYQFSLSVRNTGTSKVEMKDIHQVRRMIDDSLVSDREWVEREIIKYLEESRVCLVRLRDERQSKEKSIDDILGI